MPNTIIVVSVVEITPLVGIVNKSLTEKQSLMLVVSVVETTILARIVLV
jgi:hypothetical protein